MRAIQTTNDMVTVRPLAPGFDRATTRANRAAAGPEAAVSIVVYDVEPLVRRGIRAILESEPQFAVVTEAFDRPSLARSAVDHDIDVIVVDHAALAEVWRWLPEDFPPSINVVAVAGKLSPIDLASVLHQDVHGLVSRSGPHHDFVRAVCAAASGERFIAPDFAATLIEIVRMNKTPARPPVDLGVDRLTAREQEVLRLICRGLANQEIGKVLHIGEKTVKYHVSNVLAKAGVRSRAQLIAVMAASERSRVPTLTSFLR